MIRQVTFGFLISMMSSCLFLLSLSVLSHAFGAVDKTSSSFSAHGKIGNFIIIINASGERVPLGTISVRFCTKVSGWLRYTAVKKYRRKLQPPEFGARALRTDRRQPDRQQTDGFAVANTGTSCSHVRVKICAVWIKSYGYIDHITTTDELISESTHYLFNKICFPSHLNYLFPDYRVCYNLQLRGHRFQVPTHRNSFVTRS